MAQDRATEQGGGMPSKGAEKSVPKGNQGSAASTTAGGITSKGPNVGMGSPHGGGMTQSAG